MTNKQIASILYNLFENSGNKSNLLDKELNFYNLEEIKVDDIKESILQKFNSGINKLNKNQLHNILEKISQSNFDEELIKSRLKFYEIDRQFFSEILEFFKYYFQMNIAIDVADIDSDFKGIQVASRDDFNTIINQGWTGDWVMTPSSVTHNRVQVASMNETGRFPRGYYLNAEIENITPIQYGDQVRYRIFIKNPIIVDSGNRNVKFNLNPVKYID